MSLDSQLPDSLQRHVAEFENEWWHWDPSSSAPRPSASRRHQLALDEFSGCSEDERARFVTRIVFIEIWQRKFTFHEEPTPRDFAGGEICAAFPGAVDAAFAELLRPAATGSLRTMTPPFINNAMPAEAIPRQLGPFEVIELLGKGSFGRVYKARDPAVGREVAIKVPIGKMGEDLLANREIRAVGDLEYDGIVPVYHIGHDGPPQSPMYVVMKYIAGSTLRSRLREKKYDVVGALDLILQISVAVAKAHKKKILHLDLKPANILLDLDDRPWVTDFGLAVHERSVADHTARGTPGYMSPNQWSGRPSSKDDDIFSIGVILYEVLTGDLPFGAESLANHDLKFKPPSLKAAGIPAELDGVCRKCLAATPDEKYPSLDDLVEDLRRILNKLDVGPDSGQRTHARQRERLAISELHEDRPHHAITALRESVSIYTGNAYAHYLLGLAYLITGVGSPGTELEFAL